MLRKHGTEVLFPGDGEMPERVRGCDWAATPLGPVSRWPESLVTTVRLVLESRYAMCIAWGPELACVYNDAFVPILGPRHPAALGAGLAKTWADAWPRVEPHVEQVLGQGRSAFESDFEIVTDRRGEPEETYFTYSYSPVIGPAGCVDGLLVVCEETTQRVLRERRERMLRRFAAECVGARSDEEVWAAILASIEPRDLPFAFFYRADPDGSLQRERGYGIDLDGPLCPPVLRLDDPDAPWPVREAAERGPILVENLSQRFPPVRGSAWPEPIERALVVPVTLGDGKPPVGFAIQGLSPRRPFDAAYRDFVFAALQQTTTALASARVAAQVQAAEERLRLALEASRMVAWDWNIETGTMLHVGDITAFYEMRPGEIFDSIDDAWKFVYEEDREETRRTIENGVASGRDYAATFRLRERPDREPRWIEVRGSPDPPSPNAESPRWVHGVCIDVTERRRVEEILRQDHAQKDRFLATLGHELRNPIAALDNALQLLERGAADPETLRRTLATHVRQLGVLVDDLLEVARIARGKLVLRKQPLALAEVVRGAIEAVQERIERARQRLTVELPEGLVIEADPTRLQQVITNLLANATKYTPQAGSITLRVDERKDEVEIVVEDSGRGMSPELIETAFDPFAQGDVGEGGLGIGLSLVRGLVELHGGSVRAESEGAERGSRFVVRIPRGNVSSAHPIAEAPRATALETGLRVLIVDDLRDAADSLAILLRLDGCETHVAYDAAQGLARARELRPDVVLLDIGLPDRSGYEVAEELRGLPETDGIHLIAVTGYGDEASERRMREVGFDERLVKPVQPRVLRERLSALARRRMSEV